jgi:flagellar hook-associated protein 2
MAITAAGVGSGLDIENIVSQLMSLERRPLEAIQQKVRSVEADISSLGTFKSKLSTFQDAMEELSTLDAFKKFTTESTDEDVLTASADSDAAAGSFSVDVTRLAQNSRYGSKEFADGATIGGGVGDALVLGVNGDSMSIDLSSALTVDQLRDAINSNADNPGVTATVLNVGGGAQRLLVTADESGYDNRVEISYGGGVNASTFDFALTNKDINGDPLVDLTELDAAFSIDGFALTASSNNVSDVVDGLTLELKDIGSSVLTTGRDDEAIEESGKQFVDAYNELLASIGTLQNANADARSLGRNVERSLRGALNIAGSGLDSTFTALSQIGITTNATTGELEFDSSDFSAALDTDFASVANLFANDEQGVAFRFDALADQLADDDGLIETRIDSLNDQTRSLEDREISLESRLELKEKSLRSEYAALDSLLANLQSTSSYLLQNLSG